MDFETFWNALQAKAKRIGMDLSDPDVQTALSNRNLKALLQQAHQQGIEHAQKAAAAKDCFPNSVRFDDLFKVVGF